MSRIVKLFLFGYIYIYIYNFKDSMLLVYDLIKICDSKSLSKALEK